MWPVTNPDASVPEKGGVCYFAKAAFGYLRASPSGNQASPAPAARSLSCSAFTRSRCAFKAGFTASASNVERSLPPFPSRTNRRLFPKPRKFQLVVVQHNSTLHFFALGMEQPCSNHPIPGKGKQERPVFTLLHEKRTRIGNYCSITAKSQERKN